MGLDMYLEARRFMWVFDAGSGEDAEAARKIRMKPNYATAEAAYWRKANAIHKWFVDNVQEGEDDCGHYHVDREQLAQLADLCDEVLKDPERASELLPTQSGFFFGGTEHDEWYLEGLRYTRDRIRDLLSRDELKGWEFHYHSSW
jgi:hypothetical protein